MRMDCRSSVIPSIKRKTFAIQLNENEKETAKKEKEGEEWLVTNLNYMLPRHCVNGLP